jgi:galactokinase
VALVADAAVDDFVPAVADGYRATTGHEPALYPVTASAGAGPLTR